MSSDEYDKAIADLQSLATEPPAPVISDLHGGYMLEMENALRMLRPGERVVYYCGFLPEDRRHSYPVDRLADLAYSLWEKGRMHLFQKPVVSSIRKIMYEYIAIGRPHRRDEADKLNGRNLRELMRPTPTVF